MVDFELWLTSESWLNFDLWVTFELWLNFELWLTFELWVGGGTSTQANTQTHRHINTMTRPGLGAGPSENMLTVDHLHFFFF